MALCQSLVLVVELKIILIHLLRITVVLHESELEDWSVNPQDTPVFLPHLVPHLFALRRTRRSSRHQQHHSSASRLNMSDMPAQDGQDSRSAMSGSEDSPDTTSISSRRPLEPESTPDSASDETPSSSQPEAHFTRVQLAQIREEIARARKDIVTEVREMLFREKGGLAEAIASRIQAELNPLFSTVTVSNRWIQLQLSVPPAQPARSAHRLSPTFYCLHYRLPYR
ncbi:unnamed protein product [Cyclocybe aegerita]|uniref:Uncharacterized protein n=1 Tax=Cyclocybe aegerita TaxID=1973307 RepID=A0A8S0XLM9_CYCAE|nr:unnamed protein product [Cyclocybe aegerita]